MDQYVVEKRVSCPFCGEPITVLIDTSAGPQSYIEDCQVCCQPMQVSADVDGDEHVSVEVDRGS